MVGHLRPLRRPLARDGPDLNALQGTTTGVTLGLTAGLVGVPSATRPQVCL
jgi:hypothetical protein